MQNLLARASKLQTQAAVLEPPKPFKAYRRRTNRWRLLLDKVFVLLQCADLQLRLSSWAVQDQSSGSHNSERSSSSKDKQAKKDISREKEIELTIKYGKQLKPTKTQNSASCKPEECKHSKCRFFDNGNQRSVGCQECHSRWEAVQEEPSTATAASSSEKPVEATPKLQPSATTKAKAKAQPPPTPPRMPTPPPHPATFSPTGWWQQPSIPNMGQMAPNCLCNLPCKYLMVKKEGPTQGRHFFKCQRQLCQFFQWDLVETETILMAQMQQATASLQGRNMTPQEELQLRDYQEQLRMFHLQWDMIDADEVMQT
jgi:hypothetical protein